jgi:hypothetical protein
VTPSSAIVAPKRFVTFSIRMIGSVALLAFSRRRSPASGERASGKEADEVALNSPT